MFFWWLGSGTKLKLAGLFTWISDISRIEYANIAQRGRVGNEFNIRDVEWLTHAIEGSINQQDQVLANKFHIVLDQGFFRAPYFVHSLIIGLRGQ